VVGQSSPSEGSASADSWSLVDIKIVGLYVQRRDSTECLPLARASFKEDIS
jgi:hypothetical protein